MLSVTNSITFMAAHCLHEYEGACKNIHGHTWKVELTVESQEILLSSIGLYLDFKLLKGFLKEFVHDVYDHKLILNAKHPLNIGILHELTDIVQMAENPTAENLAISICKDINKAFRRTCIRFSKITVTVYESEQAYATYSTVANEKHLYQPI